MIRWSNLDDAEREPYLEKASLILRDLYVCSRVWDAWQYGTMGPDDFSLAAEDAAVVSDAAEELFDFVQKRMASEKNGVRT